jgi:hypothetical protein
MLTKPQYNRLLERVLKVSQRETNTLLKSLPKDFKERLASVPQVAIRFKDRQVRDKNDHRAKVEPLSMTSRDTREIVIYVMPIFEQHGGEPGAFRLALQKVIMQELADWAGIEVDLNEE